MSLFCNFCVQTSFQDKVTRLANENNLLTVKKKIVIGEDMSFTLKNKKIISVKYSNCFVHCMRMRVAATRNKMVVAVT